MSGKVATGTMLRTSLDNTLRFVYYHLNLGVDHMFLYFDNKNDPAIETLECIPKVTCVRCDDAFWKDIPHTFTRDVHKRQSVCLMRAFRKVKAMPGFEWLFHIDSDELMYFPDGLHETLSKTPNGANTFRLFPLEAVCENMYPEHAFEDSTFFKRRELNKSVRDALEKRLKEKHPELFCNRLLRGHIYGKSAVRLSSCPQDITCHEPIFTDEVPKIEYYDPNSFILHYESNSFDDWKNKMDRWRVKDPAEQELTLRMKALMPQIDKVKEAYNSYYGDDLTKALEDIYCDFYCCTDDQKLDMLDLGLAVDLHIDQTMFNIPTAYSY